MWQVYAYLAHDLIQQKQDEAKRGRLNCPAGSRRSEERSRLHRLLPGRNRA